MRAVRTSRGRKEEVAVAGPQILGSDFYAVSIVNKGKRRHQQNKNGKNL